MSDEITQRPDPEEIEVKPEESGRSASLTELFASWVSRSPSPGIDIASKMTPEHLTQSLGMVDAENQRVLDDRNDQRKTTRYYVTVGALAALGITAMLVFSGNASLMENFLEWVLLLGAGAFGGSGWVKGKQ